jgi:hypothetical protein
MRGQRGASVAFVFVVLLLVMVVLGAMLTLSRGNTAIDEQVQTKRNLDAASAAIEQFTSTTGRLPCPAKPDPDAASDGVASPDAPSINCDYPSTGVLPWRTVGMRHDDAFDAWGWKISYRVYSNTNGSLTQDKGASMVNCDTVQALTTRKPVDGATKLCPGPPYDTADTDFIAGKGLPVNDFGAGYNGTTPAGGAAYMLVSHGATGLGAYSSSGIRKDMPTSLAEKNNTNDVGPFTLKPASDPDLPATDINHFDDILLYRTVGDLAKRANLVARDWPDDILAGVKFDSNALQSVLGRSPSSGDLGVTSLAFPFATVSGFNSGGAQNLTFVAGSNTGLGGASGGNDLNSSGGEGIRVDLQQSARKFAVTLDNFGIVLSTWKEQAEFRFYNGSTLVATVVERGCQSDSSNRLASFTIDPGATFTAVEMRSMTSTPDPFFWTTLASSFIISEFDTCTAAATTCKTTLAIADPSTECP